MDDPTHAQYYSACIPRSYWGPPSEKPPRFSQATVDPDAPPIPAATQLEFYNKIVKGNLWNTPSCFLFISEGDDQKSLQVGFDLAKRATQLDKKVNIVQSANYFYKYTEEKVHMMHNVYDEAPFDRIQRIRDWYFRHDDCFRYLCAAGNPAVLLRRYKLKFNGIFYMAKGKKKTRSLREFG